MYTEKCNCYTYYTLRIITRFLIEGIDCKWGDWNEGECSVSCGNGTRNITRSKTVIEQYGGSCNDKNGSRTETCKVIECPGKIFTSRLEISF